MAGKYNKLIQSDPNQQITYAIKHLEVNVNQYYLWIFVLFTTDGIRLCSPKNPDTVFSSNNPLKASVKMYMIRTRDICYQLALLCQLNIDSVTDFQLHHALINYSLLFSPADSTA